MASSVCGYSNLNENTVKKINDLEKDLGIPILAFSCNQLEAAPLDDRQLKKLQAAENELGVSLVAVNG